MTMIDTMLEAAKKAFAADDMATAERLCRSIVTAAPKLAGPWIILGDIELHRRRPDAALVWADKAVALEPHNAFGYLVRCNCLVALSRLKEAFETAEIAIGLKDCPSTVLSSFGVVFSQLGRHSHVLDAFRRAVAAAPQNEQALFNLAVAERTFGQIDQAESHCEQVISRNKHFYGAYFIRADIRKQTRDCNHVLEMEKLIASGISDTGGGALIHFALGKELEDIGDYKNAFRHIKAGAELQRGRLRYDVKRNVGVIDRIIKAQTREVLDATAARPRPSPLTSDDPIFIVGLPRSGTTLLERIITSHSHVAAAGELNILPNQLIRAAIKGGVTRAGEWVEQLDAIDLAAVGIAYSRIARETGIAGGHRITDKNPANYLYCGVIRLAFPNARIIALKRRPMDSCYALYKQLFADSMYPYSYDLGDLAEYYSAFRRLMAHWRSVLPPHQFLEVSYEDVVTDLEGQSRRIAEFLDIPWEEGFLHFHESEKPVNTASAMQVRQPIYASSVGKWRHYAEELVPLHVGLKKLLPPDEMQD